MGSASPARPWRLARAYERGSRAVGSAEAVITKRRVAYAAATAAADAPSRREDNGWCLGTTLRQTLALFNAPGEGPDLTSRQAESAAIVHWLDD